MTEQSESSASQEDSTPPSPDDDKFPLNMSTGPTISIFGTTVQIKP